MNRVYILGSGFSADAGLPLSRDILKVIFNNHRYDTEVVQLKDWLAKNFYPHEPDWINHNNFSEILSRIDLIRYYKPIKQANYKEIDYYETILIKLFIKVLTGNGPRTIPEPFLKFAAGLRNQDTVITFNHDMIIESALETVGKSLHYLYEKNNSKASIPILKLHGSVNLVYCPICHRIDWSIQNTCPICHSTMKPLIIAPTFFKSYHIPAIRDIWFEALKSLTRANELIFIGYSMPSDDLLSHQLFDFGYRLNPSAPVTVINGHSPDMTIFQNIYQQGSTNLKLKFVEFMEKL